MNKGMSRREFVGLAARASLAAGVSAGLPWGAMKVLAFGQSPTNIRKFVVNLPGVGPGGANSIGQYLPLAKKRVARVAGQMTDIYNMAATQFSQTMHPDLPGPTTLWGYGDLKDYSPNAAGNNIGQQYLGGVIVAKKGTPTILNMTNLLPSKHILPFDPMVMVEPGVMTGDVPQNRIITHLHGGHVPWFSDGTSMQWYTPDGVGNGPSYMEIPGLPTVPGTLNHYYPNDHSGRLMWFHDHAMGNTRLNAYAGMASAYILVDDFEISLVHHGLLPDLVGVPLIIQDKSFVPSNIATQDPTWDSANWGGPGSLWYPHEYEANTLPGGIPNPKGRVDYGPTDAVPPAAVTMPLPPVSLIPEAFLDTIMVNGGLYPVHTVAPKRVRFRMLNAAQARFFHMNLYQEDPAAPGEPLLTAPGPIMYQVGTEGGLLPTVVPHTNTTPCPLDLVGDPTGNTAIPTGPFNLLLAPAERADVVIDFNGVPAGTTFILYGDAPAPFPGGDSRNDYYTGQADQTAIGGAPTTAQGFGPNTRTMMKFVVGQGGGDAMPTATWLTKLNTRLRTNYLTGNQPGFLYNTGDPSVPAFPFVGVVDRQLTLNENFDTMGRLQQLLGTMTQNGLNSQGLPEFGMSYEMPSTENPVAGSTEVWQIFNLSMDVHPIHFHLVNAQIIERQAFMGDPVAGIMMTGAPMPPDPNEVGWKETIRMNPMEATTIIMKFDLPALPTPAMTNAVSPRTGGKEYMWHCHILEHEEHEMMRPMVVS